MKYLKKYMLLLSALAFIVLGAALPFLTSQMQDAQISRTQIKMELNTVNLTLRQESDVWPVLQLMSKIHGESPWAGETVLTKADASEAALAVLETMEQYGLLPAGELEQLLKSEGKVEPLLLVGEDGSSALIWACTWDDSTWTFITIDDVTGKAVRILVGNTPTDSGVVESVSFQLEKWCVFLEDYYDIELTEGKRDSSSSTAFAMCFSSKDGATDYDLSLEIDNGYTLFNYLQLSTTDAKTRADG